MLPAITRKPVGRFPRSLAYSDASWFRLPSCGCCPTNVNQSPPPQSRFTEAQFIGMINEQDARLPTAELRRKHRTMRLRVPGVGLELGQWPHLDPIRGKAQRHHRVIPRIKVDTPGFRTPGSRLDSTRGPAVTRSVQHQGFEFAVFQAGSEGRGFQVASQKSGPVASDVPRFARQHTNMARKEPEISGLAGWTPVGPLAGPRKPAARCLLRAPLPSISRN